MVSSNQDNQQKSHKKIIKLKPYQNAFSLVEISLVILIIGILIAGVSSGLDLYYDMKLTNAQNLTINSRVGRIPDLVAWHETTLENNFSSGTTNFIDIKKISDNQVINRWKDINPTSLFKNNLIQSIASSQPTIKTNSINNLPGLQFDGDDRLLTNNYCGESFSLFVVMRTINGGVGSSTSQAWQGSAIIGADVAGGASDIIPLALGGGFVKIFTGVPETTLSSTIKVNDNKPYILFSSRNIANGNRTIMINNANIVSDNLGGNGLLNASSQVAIGGDANIYFTPFNGELSEVIVYSRILLTSEIKAVNQYLAQKYNIKL